MPTQAEAQRYRLASIELGDLLERDLTDLWRSLDLSQPEAVRDELLRTVPALTTQYGVASASLAADWYDGLRVTEGVSGRFASTMAAPAPIGAVEGSVRYAASHLFTDTPDGTLILLGGAVRRHALQAGRDTIRRAAAADPESVGWQRVVRSGACGFCRLLAGRGGVYKRGTVAFAAHDNCTCAAVPSWDPDAPEVPVEAYQASERMEKVRRRAADGNKKAQQVLADHRKRTREYIAELDDN